MPPRSTMLPTRRTRVVLATAHRDHDPTNRGGANPAALGQRCHILKRSPSTCDAGRRRVAVCKAMVCNR